LIDIALTNKQVALLKVIVEGNGHVEGKFSPCDLDQIIERVSYHPSKDSLQFSIRKLIEKGAITKSGFERRRDRRRVLIAPTKLGRQLMQPTLKKESYVETEVELEY
jgi:DNA-binding MarR family transcriptional regulator